MRILFLTFFFPPYNTMGAVRTGKTAKYLTHLGHSVHVISACPQALTEDLEVEIPRSSITYTSWIGRRKLKRPAHVADVPARDGREKRALTACAKSIYWELMIPDQQLGWFPTALWAAMSVIRRGGADIIFASGSPFTTLLVGRAAAHFGDLPWVAELRDPWMDNQLRERFVLRDFVETPLEHWTLADADGLVTVTSPWAAQLRAKYDAPVEVVYNGFEPQDVSMPECRDADRLVIRHMGSMYDEKRLPHALLRCLGELDDSGLPIHVEFYGQDLGRVRGAAAAAGVAGVVRCYGTAAHRESLRLQRNADVLLLSLAPSERDVLPGKLFEYMNAHRPVLVLGCPGGEAANLVRSTACGVVVDGDAALKTQLEAWRSVKMETGTIPDGPSPPEEFTRAEQTRKLAAFLERVVETHNPPRRRLWPVLPQHIPEDEA